MVEVYSEKAGLEKAERNREQAERQWDREIMAIVIMRFYWSSQEPSSIPSI